jgi:hypothetical protein
VIDNSRAGNPTANVERETEAPTWTPTIDRERFLFQPISAEALKVTHPWGLSIGHSKVSPRGDLRPDSQHIHTWEGGGMQG